MFNCGVNFTIQLKVSSLIIANKTSFVNNYTCPVDAFQLWITFSNSNRLNFVVVKQQVPETTIRRPCVTQTAA